jgi:peptide/nickel transport system ATP-binding protein
MDEKEKRVRQALQQAELNPPERYLNSLPSQLSGGEKQRVSIARALVVEPDVILADEPVSMLDVSTQAAILELLSELIDELGLSMLYISHDLSTVAYVCDLIHVMYLGRIVESAQTLDLVQDPLHPYAQTLIDAIPVPDPHHGRPRVEIEGSPRTPVDIGEGCRFRDRCPERMDICENTPKSINKGGREVACHLYYEHSEYDETELPAGQATDGGTQ